MYMKFIVYNPFRYIPFFRFEKMETTVIEKDDKQTIIDKVVINTDKNIMIFDGSEEAEISQIPITTKSKIFFFLYELLFSAVIFIWSLYLFLSTRTDVISLVIFVAGFLLSTIFCLKQKFILANFLISLTAITVMINLFIFYRRFEIVFQHIGILMFGFFFVVFILYRIVKKNNLMNKAKVWYEPINQNGKRFFIVESDYETPLAPKQTIKKSETNKEKSDENK